MLRVHIHLNSDKESFHFDMKSGIADTNVMTDDLVKAINNQRITKD